ncbi:hypothetical protein [Pantoea eucrina]|uniref:hypothetical protein n=1 Tax=Pantoea eucrina TaxID=472693 RepID=UPI000A22C285|nr:hypothetical protein [Pantoea eucrina]ORM78871.1 hypothetical protein HA43_06175 [Pantoea eucrina]
MSIVKLQFSDGRPDVAGLEDVNQVLNTVGVRASTIDIPAEARPLLKAYQNRAITEGEEHQLISMFNLTRPELMEQIRLAGRTPVIENGGEFTTEGGQSSYPKVYDMKAMSEDVQKFVLNKYGRLHVNTSDKGQGIDEVMTVIAGGPFTWMYLLPDGVLARLTVGFVGENDKALRLSYPGIRMHAGYMDAKEGLVVAFAHGPDNFEIRYEADIEHAELLGDNPWVDFTGDMPKLYSKLA